MTNREQLLENLYIKYQVALEESGFFGGASGDCPERIVRGSGAFDSRIALVGEAPGGEEEKLGKPFVGSAGKKLTGFLQMIDVSRDEVYITNVVKFRPKAVSSKTGKYINRLPAKEEIDLCAPFLFEELKIVAPQLVVTLGNVALKALTGDSTIRIGSYHGRVLELSQLVIFPMYHPASVIYNQKLNEVYEADLMRLRELLDGEKWKG